MIVRRALPADVPDMALTLSHAFAHDPFFGFLAGDAPERSERMRQGWSGILRFASAHLAETYTTDDRAGVAIWHPPGHSAPSLLDSFRMLPNMARLTGWRRLSAVAQVMGTIERLRKTHAPAPHFYLSALGVDPTRQGQGIGSALLRPILDRCATERITAYLETATARNVLLYEHLGFEVVDDLILPGTDIHGWLMLRPAPTKP